MKRIALVCIVIALMAACYHDNASPFVHGANVKPMQGTNTMVPATSSANEQSTTTQYNASSGRAGGVREVPVSDTSK